MIPADFIAFPGLLSMASSRYSTELLLQYIDRCDIQQGNQLAFNLCLLSTQ